MKLTYLYFLLYFHFAFKHVLTIYFRFQGGGGMPMIDTIKRHEVDRVMNNQNELLQNARELRYGVNTYPN